PRCRTEGCAAVARPRRSTSPGRSSVRARWTQTGRTSGTAQQRAFQTPPRCRATTLGDPVAPVGFPGVHRYPRPVTDENKAIVQAMWRAFTERDFDRFAAFFTDDAEWLAPANNATAFALEVSSHMIGRTAITDFFADDFPRL